MFNAHKFSATPGQKPVIVLNNRGLRIFIEQIVSTRADDFPVRLSNVLRLSELPLGKSRFTIGD